MRYKSITFLLFIFSQISYGQTELCTAIIFWKHEQFIKIYDKPNENELLSLQNDIKNENYLSLKIIESKNNFFRVKISLAFNDSTYTGWIKKAHYIGAFMKNEQEYMDVKLFHNPYLKSSEVREIKNWKAGFVTIEECEDIWTKITITVQGKRVTGWIKTNKLCPNNYSTCS